MAQQRYVQKRQANHTLHLILTICTCGLWAITGWPIAAIMGRKTVTTMPAPQGYYPPPPQGQQHPAPPHYGPGQYGPPQR